MFLTSYTLAYALAGLAQLNHLKECANCRRKIQSREAPTWFIFTVSNMIVATPMSLIFWGLAYALSAWL